MMRALWLAHLVYLTALSTLGLSDGAMVMNCTFSRTVFGFQIPDITYCMYTQSIFDSFNWTLGSAETPTPDTGPTSDHTGSRGHFAYVESSFRGNNTYGRLSSPTFTKPASESGGCVQFYYHMYGEDMGTLNVSVYDNTQSGPVALWSKSGDQGNQWLRADIDLNLSTGQDLDIQVIIDGYVEGAMTNNKKGDIAIDDIIIYNSGACSQSSEETIPKIQEKTITQPKASLTTETTKPYMWSCDFESLSSKTCGMTLRNYGAGFSAGTRSHRPSTGPSSDKSGSGHYLLMQAIGKRVNSSAAAETPRFDQPHHCFTFWYHMYGAGMGQLRVEVDLDGNIQEIWSMTGNQGNEWKLGRVAIPPRSIKVIITAVRGSTSDSDIALDNLSLSVNNCQGLTMPPMITTTTIPQPTTRAQPALTLACNFDQDSCNFYKDPTGDLNWKRLNGPTYQSGTGPSSDHTRGDFSGYYMYLPTNYKSRPTGQKARIQTGLIDTTFGGKACLRFSYHMYGADMGTLNVRIKTQAGEMVSSFVLTGDKGNMWKQKSIDVTFTQAKVYIEFEGTVEHDGTPYRKVKGEMAIDDIMLTSTGSCQDLDLLRVSSLVTVPTTTTQTTGTIGSTTTPTKTPSPPTTTPSTTPTTTPSPIQECNFDNNSICGFTQSWDDDFDWSRLNTRTWSGNTGPARDHTHGDLSGYFLYIEPSYRPDGDMARLRSPFYNKLSNAGCLSFWYHMWGRDIGQLKVTLNTSAETVVWQMSGDQGNQWTQATVQLDLTPSTNFQIYFDGYVSHQLGSLKEVLGDIAIDDVHIDRLNSCGGSPVTMSTGSPSSASSSGSSSSTVSTPNGSATTPGASGTSKPRSSTVSSPSASKSTTPGAGVTSGPGSSVTPGGPGFPGGPGNTITNSTVNQPQKQTAGEKECHILLRAVISPDTGLAVIEAPQLNNAGMLYLPPGTYNFYHKHNSSINCTTNVIVSDCSIANDAKPKLTSSNGTLTVMWPTTLEFNGTVTAIPGTLEKMLQNRLRAKGLMLSIFISGRSPPLVYPRRTGDDTYAAPYLASYCRGGVRYDPVSDTCDISLALLTQNDF